MDRQSNKLYTVEYEIGRTQNLVTAISSVEHNNVQLIFCATNFGIRPSEDSWKDPTIEESLKVYTIIDGTLTDSITKEKFQHQAKAELKKDWDGRGLQFPVVAREELVKDQIKSFNLLSLLEAPKESYKVSQLWGALPENLKKNRNKSKLLVAAEGSGPITEEKNKVFLKCKQLGKKKILLDAGISIVGEGVIDLDKTHKLNLSSEVFYTDSFDAASAIQGCGKITIKRPICEDSLEMAINTWIKEKIIQPLVAYPAPSLPDYFIHAGCNFKKAIILEMTVYTNNIDTIKKLFTDLNRNAQIDVDKTKNKVEQVINSAKKMGVENGRELTAENLAVRINRNTSVAGVINIVNETEQVKILEKIALKMKKKAISTEKAAGIVYNTSQTKLRYLICIPKTEAQCFLSVSCPPPEYAMSVTQAQLNGISAVQPNPLLAFSDSNFWEKVGSLASDEEKQLFCGMQKRNCDQNDAIAAALLGNEGIVISVDQPMIAAAVARNASGCILQYEGKKLSADFFIINNELQEEKRNLLSLYNAGGAGAGAGAGAEEGTQQKKEQQALKRREKDSLNKLLYQQKEKAAQAFLRAQNAIKTAIDGILIGIEDRAKRGRLRARTENYAEAAIREHVENAKIENKKARAATTESEVKQAAEAAGAAANRAEAEARGAAQAAQEAEVADVNMPGLVPVAAPVAERHRHRYSRKPNKPRRRSTRKHKN